MDEQYRVMRRREPSRGKHQFRWVAVTGWCSLATCQTIYDQEWPEETGIKLIQLSTVKEKYHGRV